MIPLLLYESAKAQIIKCSQAGIMNKIDHIDHAALAGLRDFWIKLKGDRLAPRRSDFTPSDLKPWLGNIILINVETNPERYFVRVAGSNITHDLGEEFSGKYYDEFLSPDVYQSLSKDFQKFITSEKPFYFFGAFIESPRRVREYFRLVLPFSNDGTHIDMIMIGLYLKKTDHFPVNANNLCRAMSSVQETLPSLV